MKINIGDFKNIFKKSINAVLCACFIFFFMPCFTLCFSSIHTVSAETIKKDSRASMKTHVEFSYKNNTGNANTDNLSGKLELRKEKAKIRYFAKGFILYGRDKDQDTKQYEDALSNKWTAESRCELIFGERLFGLVAANYINDNFSGYDYRISSGPGMGYDILKTDKQFVKGLFSVLYTYDCLESDSSFSYMSGKVVIDYIWRLLDNFTLKEIVDYSFSFKNAGNSFFNSETALEMHMNKYVSFGLSYLIAYQETSPSNNIVNTDRTFLLSFIVDF